MLIGGVISLAFSYGFESQPIKTLSWQGTAALIYLTIIGSCLAFIAYSYLATRAKPALSESFAFVNPMIAIAIDVAVLNHLPCTQELFAMFFVLLSVIFVILGSIDVSVSGVATEKLC